MESNCKTDPVTHATTCDSIPIGCSIDQQAGQLVCVTNPNNPPVICQVTFQYSSADPSTAALTKVGQEGCDQAGMELAIAVVLARLLGSPH